MSAIQRPSTSDSMILFGTSFLCLFGGLFIYAERFAFASFFLGGNFAFGIPLTGSDAFELLLVKSGSIISMMMGLLILLVGVILQTRKPTEPGVPSTPRPSR
jgi:hypothetical protein